MYHPPESDGSRPILEHVRAEIPTAAVMTVARLARPPAVPGARVLAGLRAQALRPVDTDMLQGDAGGRL